MTPNDTHDELSLFALGTTLIRQRRRIALLMLLGATSAGVAAFFKPSLYRGSASFVPQSTDMSKSGLAGLAGQFGITLPIGNQSLSPDFYAKLLDSKVLLLPIVRDTFTVRELGGRRVPFLSLFEIEGKSLAAREDHGVKKLQDLLVVTQDKVTGVVEFSIDTKWRAVSLTIVRQLLQSVGEYDTHNRQGQATLERQFYESRLASAGEELKVAESRMEDFMRANRDITNSPNLSLERDRLQRTLGFRQQVFTSLTQSYDDARIRELRDTPVITIFEPPAVPAEPEPRGRIKLVALGLLVGGVIGIAWAFWTEFLARTRGTANPDADEFMRELSEMRWFGRRRARSRTSVPE